MILDSSALVAIALDEPERTAFVERINAADHVAIGAPTLVEAEIVLSARIGDVARPLLDALIETAEIIVVDFTTSHCEVAVAAWSRYGRSRHPAGLNFGDCLSYAVARVAGEPLLAKGDDFPLTDIELA